MTRAYNMDCMEAMCEFPDKHFELAIVDPPYKEDVSGLNAGINRQFEYKNFSPLNSEYIQQLFRVSKNQIIWGLNYFLELLKNTDGFICWHKHQTAHFSECELAWSSIGKGKLLDRSFNLDRYNKIHPTQKPVYLYKWILINYAKEGDKILDTHLGSGSSRIAAYDLGFDFTGYEIDKDYFDAQEKRFKNHKAQLKLFTTT